MDFKIKVLFITFFITLVISIITIPILRRLKIGQIERNDGPRSHLSKQGTPTMGGIIIILGTIISTIIVLIYYYKKNQLELIENIIPILIFTLGFGFVGFIDDFIKLILKNTKGLKPLYKMVGLLIISVVYSLYIQKVLNIGTETYIPIIRQYINLPMTIYIPFVVFVMLATTNAVNLTDGVDGLATSVTTIIITCLTVIGVIYDVKEIVIYGSIVCGANLAFLIFNLNPAKIFMGDTGSLFLGGVIAGMSIYLKMPLILIVLAIIPILETISDIIQVLYYKKTGNRIFKMAPLHHHFELSGWSENKVVSIFSVVTLIGCIIGLNII